MEENTKIIIERTKRNLERRFRYATNDNPMETPRTYYGQAFAIIEFASDLLWSMGEYKTCQEVEELWTNEWETKFQELLHQGEAKASPPLKGGNLLCGKFALITESILRSMAQELTLLWNQKEAGNTAKSDCLTFRAQLSSGNAIEGQMPLFFFGHFVQVSLLRLTLWRAARARAHPGARGPNFNPISTCQNSNQHA